MPPKWDDAKERKFLLTIIHVCAPGTPNWQQIAELMDDGSTGNALRQRFDKMKKEAREQFGEMTNGGGTGTPVKTPVKKAGGTGKKAAGEKSTGKRKNEEAELNGGEEETPSKKVKAEKTEEDDGEDFF